MSIADKLKTVAENAPKVYEAGKQAEYDAFWDNFQNYGNRKNYSYAFYNYDYTDHFQWNQNTLRPKYDIIPTNANRIMNRLKGITDLGEHFDKLGIKFDLSQSTNNALMFPYGDFVKLPVIDCSNATTIENTFNYNYNLETIEKLVMSEKITTGNKPFVECRKLENIVIEGVMALSISFQHCPLSVASLKSIIKHLKPYYGTADEFTYTLTVKTSAWEALEEAGFTDEDYQWVFDNWGSPPDLYDSWDTLMGGWLGWNLVLA